jgi:hypothetical protein
MQDLGPQIGNNDQQRDNRAMAKTEISQKIRNKWIDFVEWKTQSLHNQLVDAERERQQLASVYLAAYNGGRKKKRRKSLLKKSLFKKKRTKRRRKRTRIKRKKRTKRRLKRKTKRIKTKRS